MSLEWFANECTVLNKTVGAEALSLPAPLDERKTRAGSEPLPLELCFALLNSALSARPALRERRSTLRG
jgi:hypothetical protein